MNALSETTTGPLGQGFATAVGMALAEQKLGAEFNQADAAIVDHRTWVIVGDGCLMEGISHEAGSLAGTLGLGKLICIYDDNGISIDGAVDGWFSEDVPARFEAYGWRVIRNVDGHDADEISQCTANSNGFRRTPHTGVLPHDYRVRLAEQTRHCWRAWGGSG